MARNKKTSEGQYAPIPYAILKSDAWRSLPGAAVRVFLELHTRFNGSNNGSLRLSYAEAAEILNIGKATAQRAFRDLQDRGFIVLERKGNWYHRQAHEWRLTIKPVQRVKGRLPPTHDWRSYRRPENSERGSRMDQKAQTVVPLQNPSGADGSKPEPVKGAPCGSLGSGTEH